MKRRAKSDINPLVDWLDLVEPSGPFLTLPVLKRVFPNGIPRTDADIRAEARLLWEDITDEPAARAEWLGWVLRRLLGYGDSLVTDESTTSKYQHHVAEQNIWLCPDFVLLDPPADGGQNGHPRLLVEAYKPGSDLTKRLPTAERWSASPIDRMAILCRGTGVELGLVTNTDAFTLVWAPRGGAVATATWHASLWPEERGLFDSFVACLEARRFFAVVPGDTLESMLSESATAQLDVTAQLGLQVRQAVELLVDAFSRANRASGGQVLDDLCAGDLETAAEIMYSAAATVMMRLVFLLCAEERRLFPIGDPIYDESYAVSTLLQSLQEDARLQGVELLERRKAAWSRLLAVFRLVHDGVQHETLRVPAYGGSLFDPDRYPFMEGRRPGQAAGSAASVPAAVDDRSVMAILGALQFLTFKGETRRISYRALDVEQIGHVYEGLLDHGCRVVDTVTVGLGGLSTPELPLADIESQFALGAEAFASWVADRIGRNGTASISRDIARPVDAQTLRYLKEACEHNDDLVARIIPFVALLRRDLRGLPVVFLPGSVCMTQTSSRRDSGTEYTTKDLADEVVTYTLEPLVYSPGPHDGKPRDQWQLRTSKEILALRVCDPAVGSGAILVAACRYLAERLAEAWAREDEKRGDTFTDRGDMTISARRAVVDHCLFGVDRNPMAAEMAKLSLWLVTMAKDRPFSFLDHAIQSGDSLLGLVSIDQLTTFHIDATRGRETMADLWGHAGTVRSLLRRAVEKYREMAAIRVVTARDASAKALLHSDATSLIGGLGVIADAIVGVALRAAEKGDVVLDRLLSDLAASASVLAESEFAPPVDPESRHRSADAARLLRAALDQDTRPRIPLHWPLAFPEIFLAPDRPSGFDAVVGNPPFLGGKRISGPLGTDYREFLVRHIAHEVKGTSDLVAYFFLRASELLAEDAFAGLLATNTIAQGDTRTVGLQQLVDSGITIYRAVKSRPWPGAANLDVSQVWFTRKHWSGDVTLNNQPTKKITAELGTERRVTGVPQRLAANAKRSFQGTVILGRGFLLAPEEAAALVRRDPNSAQVLEPYLNGEDLNGRPDHSASRLAINFRDLPLDVAETYGAAMEIVRMRVLPERAKVKRDSYRRRWWQYAERCVAMYERIKDMTRVIAVGQTTKALMPVFVPNKGVLSQTLVVIAYDDAFHLGVLSSVIHWAWVVAQSSTFGTAARYIPTDCFETFPFPGETTEITSIAERLNACRAAYMLKHKLGVTDTYNRVHAAERIDPEVNELRDIHRQLDKAVASAYGWTDLHFDHGFFETSQGVRFTVSEALRLECVDRLRELNLSRYGDEVRLGFHEPTKAKKRAGIPKERTNATSLEMSLQGDLLGALNDAKTSSPEE